MDATIIIPQFNRPELTCNCIRSLRRHEPCLWPIVVVDDGSRPDCRRTVADSDFPETWLIEQPHRGVSAAWNLGAAAARTPYLVFLNNDVVARGPMIGSLIAPLCKPDHVLAGIRRRRETSLPPDVLHRLPTQLYLQGWCFALTVEAFRHAGGFDEAMTLYWSDTDLQARVIRRHGVPADATVVSPDLPLRHLAHRTVHRQPEHRRIWQADRAEFIAKWNSL